MKALFKKLFGVDIRHGYYQDEKPRQDIAFEPSAGTATDLAALGLILRRRGDGFDLYAEVEKNGGDYLLKQPFGGDSYRFCFYLKQENPHFFSITDMPSYHMQDHIFYFSNLYDSGDGELALGDQVCKAELCAPIVIIDRTFYHYCLATPVESVTVTITSLFGDTVYKKTFFTSITGELLQEVVLDFNTAQKMTAGRYTLADSNSDGFEFYFEPQLYGERLLGVIEIYSNTCLLTGDSNDLVPEDYRFVEDDALSGIDNYHIAFGARPTLWRYMVEKRYSTNEISIASLSIDGPVSFSKSVAGDNAEFVSSRQVKLHEKPVALKLKCGDKDVLDLPNPDCQTQLTVNGVTGDFESTIRVYI